MQGDTKYNKAPIDLNLPALPLFNLLKRKSKNLCSYENNDKSIKIVFGEGKPTTNAQRILIYLMSKAPRKEDGKIDVDILRKSGVLFTYAELCKYLGIRNTTINRRQIKEDLEKLGYITLYNHKRWIEKKGGYEMGYSTVEQVQLFNVYLHDSDILKKPEKQGQLPLWTNQIKFGEVILQNLENNVYRLLDTKEIRSIHSSTALRIYGIISLHNQSKKWETGLIKLAEQIPLQTKVLKNTKVEVKKACNELIELGLIKDYWVGIEGENPEKVVFYFNDK